MELCNVLRSVSLQDSKVTKREEVQEEQGETDSNSMQRQKGNDLPFISSIEVHVSRDNSCFLSDFVI